MKKRVSVIALLAGGAAIATMIILKRKGEKSFEYVLPRFLTSK